MLSADLFHDIGDIVLDAEDRPPPWVICDHWYYRGAFIIAGAPKVGKTTMIADVVRARMAGTPWAGLDVKSGPVLLLTEEGPMPTAYHWWRADGLGVLFRYEALDAWATERKVATPGMPREVADEHWTFSAWLRRKVSEWCEGQRNPLVIVDTLATWGGVDDENDAAQMTAAISAWCRLAQETGACVLLVHHTRKGGGAHGEDIRGSSAILGTADGSWSITRVGDNPTDTRRKVTTTCRMAFSSALALDYDEREGYAIDDGGPNLGEIETWVKLVPDIGDGYAIGDLAGVWEVSRSTVQRRVKSLLDLGRLRVGTVKRKSTMAAVYWGIPPAAAARRGPVGGVGD